VLAVTMSAAAVTAQQPADTARAPVVMDDTTGPESGILPNPFLADSIVGSFRASPSLPFEHWAVQAARRAEAMGLTRFFPAQRSVPRAQVARALADAVVYAGSPARQRLTAEWAARFLEEFPEYGAGPRSFGGLTVLGGSAAVGFDRATGRLAPVIGYQGNGNVPLPLPDVSDPRASVDAGVATRWAAVSAEGAWRGGEAVLRRWEVAAAAGAFQLSLGREPLGYGYGRTGAVVYSDPDPVPRLELQTTRPVRLPWVLHGIGPVTLHTFVGPVNDPARHPTDPLLWGMRVAFQPHRRLTLGANRGSIFGGEGDPTTVKRVLGMLAGIVRSNFENQVISLDARYRAPTERVLPLTAYVEWGADDAAGAMDEEPGRIIGLLAPALPGIPEVAAGVEYTYFKRGCCGHGPWYQNFTFPGGWALRGKTLGHPLGGEGAEYAAYAQADLAAARVRLDGRAYLRDRSDFSLPRYGGGNLFTPGRTGRSTGGVLDAAVRLRPRADLRAGLALESGDGWRERSVHAALAWLF
jgi:hypothetical protein